MYYSLAPFAINSNTPMTTIDQKTAERIERDARKSPKENIGNKNVVHTGSFIEGYTIAAKHEALKAQELVEALQETLKMIQPYTPHQIREIKMKIKTALKHYDSQD